MSHINVSKMREAAEAVCGGLHKTGLFDFLGETDDGHSTWFSAGQKPTIIKVEVQRSKLHPSLAVNIKWPVIVGRQVVVGQETIRVDATNKHTRHETELACEHTVRRCLEIYRDVLKGEGVADPVTITRVMDAESKAPVENDFEVEL